MNLLDEQLLALAQPETAKKAAPSKSKGKKRRRSSRKDDDSDESSVVVDSSNESSADDLEEEFEFGEDLMGDQADRARLANMTEVERESILAEREEKRQQFLERLEIKKKLTTTEVVGSRKRSAYSSDEDEDDDSDNYNDSAARKSSRKASKKKSFSELKKDRAKNRKRQYSSDESDFDEPVQELLSSKEDLDKMQVTRDELERWCFAPFFKDTVINAFVRLGLAAERGKERVYRICQIIDVIEEPEKRLYKIGSTMTRTQLKVQHGKNIKAFTMEIISNSPFTEAEWNRLEKTMKVDKKEFSAKSLMVSKSQDLEKARNHIFTEAEVTEMIKAKQVINKNRVGNYARTRLDLQRSLDMAKQEDDWDAATRYEEELADLDRKQASVRQGQDTSRMDTFAELNRRNRSLNVKEAQEAGKTNNNTGDAAGDFEVKLLDEALLLDDDWLDDIDISVYAI